MQHPPIETVASGSFRRFLAPPAAVADSLGRTPLQRAGSRFLLSTAVWVFSAFLSSPQQCAAQSANEWPSTVYVQLESVKLRSKPQQFASGVDDVAFGDALTVLGIAKPWYDVRSSAGKRGYVHEGAVIPRKIVLGKASSTPLTSKVDSTDVYLAGKGFSADLAEENQKLNPTSDFAGVDKMIQRSQVLREELPSFAAEGKLKEG